MLWFIAGTWSPRKPRYYSTMYTLTHFWISVNSVQKCYSITGNANKKWITKPLNVAYKVITDQFSQTLSLISIYFFKNVFILSLPNLLQPKFSINRYKVSPVHTRIHWLAFLSTALHGCSENSPHRHWSNSLLLVAADKNTPEFTTGLMWSLVSIWMLHVWFNITHLTQSIDIKIL